VYLGTSVVTPESGSQPRCRPLRDSIGSTSAYPALPCRAFLFRRFAASASTGLVHYTSWMRLPRLATKDGGTFVDVEILAGAPTLEVRGVALS
jgi:hypothetical protein